MLLKRHYKDDGALDHVEILGTGANAPQNFSKRMVALGRAEGWIHIEGNTLLLEAQPERLIYAIHRKPGHYCVHDGSMIPISDEARGDPQLEAIEAQAYVRQRFAGVPSPRADVPSGYEKLNHYECTLDAEQHARWQSKTIGEARRAAAAAAKG